MKCQDCYWYNSQANGNGCIQGHEAPLQECSGFYEDWELLARISPTDPRLGMAAWEMMNADRQAGAGGRGRGAGGC